jgi:hypothetical protein
MGTSSGYQWCCWDLVVSAIGECCMLCYIGIPAAGRGGAGPRAVQEAYLGQMARTVSSSVIVLARCIHATAYATGWASVAVVVVEPLLQWSVVLPPRHGNAADGSGCVDIEVNDICEIAARGTCVY